MTNVGGGGGGGGGASAAGGGGGSVASASAAGGGGDDDLRQQLNDLLGQMRELQDLVEEIQNEELIIPPMPELEDVRLAEGPVRNPRKFTNKRMGDRICAETSRLIELGRSLRRIQSPLAAATEALAITQLHKARANSSSVFWGVTNILSPPELVAAIRLLPPEDAEWVVQQLFAAAKAKVESIFSLLTQQVVHDLPGPGGPAVHRAALPGAVAGHVLDAQVGHANRHFLLHELAPDVVPHPLGMQRSSRRQRKSRKTRKSRKNQRV